MTIVPGTNFRRLTTEGAFPAPSRRVLEQVLATLQSPSTDTPDAVVAPSPSGIRTQSPLMPNVVPLNNLATAENVIVDQLTQAYRPRVMHGRVYPGGDELEDMRTTMGARAPMTEDFLEAPRKQDPMQTFFANLQRDSSFSSLPEDKKRFVVQTRGGQEALDFYDQTRKLELMTGPVAELTRKVKRAEELAALQDQLALRTAEREAARADVPIDTVEKMVKEGKLRINPEGKLEEIDESVPGIRNWIPASPWIQSMAVEAFPKLGLGSVSMADKTARAIQIHRENPELSFDQITQMVDSEGNVRATEQIANLQNPGRRVPRQLPPTPDRIPMSGASEAGSKIGQAITGTVTDLWNNPKLRAALDPRQRAKTVRNARIGVTSGAANLDEFIRSLFGDTTPSDIPKQPWARVEDIPSNEFTNFLELMYPQITLPR